MPYQLRSRTRATTSAVLAYLTLHNADTTIAERVKLRRLLQKYKASAASSSAQLPNEA